MKGLILIIFLIANSAAFSQQAEIVKFQRISKLLESGSDRIQVINFWATWCAPCVKELPLFEKLNSEGRTDVDVTLVSLDLDLDANPEKVYKFITRKNIRSNTLLLDEPDPNQWIDKISPEWSGALPATLVVNAKTGRRKFIEGELRQGDLERIILEVQNSQ
jgi:thiol-disulfide isomerase/thioredoxin